MIQLIPDLIVILVPDSNFCFMLLTTFKQNKLDKSYEEIKYLGAHGVDCGVALCQLRWPNTVFARALANAIQRAHKDCQNQTCR